MAGFEGQYQIVVSRATLAELRETLRKYPDRFHMTDDAIQEEIETVRYFAEFVEPTEDISVVDADPDDDKFVEAAVAGSVDYLVSGDSHLLELESVRGIETISPRGFYEILSDS